MPVLDAEPGVSSYPYDAPYTNLLTTSDSPRISLGSDEGELQRDFAAKMYLMWDPVVRRLCSPATPQSVTNCTAIPVPLGYVSWQFDGAVVNSRLVQTGANSDGSANGTSWIVACGGCSSPLVFVPSQPSQDSIGYPSWSASVVP